jgi:hypothetical protein
VLLLVLNKVDIFPLFKLLGENVPLETTGILEILLAGVLSSCCALSLMVGPFILYAKPVIKLWRSPDTDGASHVRQLLLQLI